MKKILLAMSIVAVSFAANAQKNEGGVHFSVGVNAALPMGDFGDSHSFGIGGELQAEYMASENLSLTGTSGYTAFSGKEVDLGAFGKYKNPSIGYVPILVGARFYAAPEFFIGAKLGYGLFSGGGSNTSGFNYRPEVGYNGEKFQVAAGYNGVSVTGGTLSSITFTASYKFN